MSTLTPRGVPIMIGNEERHFLFDYSVIADIQEEYDTDVFTVLSSLFIESGSVGEYKGTVLINLTHKLLLDETEREKFFNGREIKSYTRRQVGWLLDRKNADDVVEAILKAWTYSMPELEKDEEAEDPNARRGMTETEDSTSPGQS